ncbi:MAG: rhomboid family intramembrane serine protease, partial [Verrucomicrobiota bacterium]
WFLIQFLSGTVAQGEGGVAFWAHVGGFVAGVVLVLPFCPSKRLEACRNKRGSASRLITRRR